MAQKSTSWRQGPAGSVRTVAANPLIDSNPQCVCGWTELPGASRQMLAGCLRVWIRNQQCWRQDPLAFNDRTSSFRLNTRGKTASEQGLEDASASAGLCRLCL